MGTRDKSAFKRGKNYKRAGKHGEKNKPTQGAFGSKSREIRRAEAEAEEKAFQEDHKKAFARLNIGNLKGKTHA